MKTKKEIQQKLGMLKKTKLETSAGITIQLAMIALLEWVLD